METKHLKKYAPDARREFIEAVTNKAAVYGLLPDEIVPMREEGDVVIIGDRPFARPVAKQRKELEARIRREGFQQFIEAVAYTWFNRFVAIRYMELHGYLDHGYRVLSHPKGKSTPEILENAERIELPGLNRDEVVDLKLDGGKDEQLYQMLLLSQCNALHKAMPFLFESIRDGTELLLPDNLLHTDSLVRTLVNDIPDEQWENVEIIGWLYQFYISERKDKVMGKVVKSEDIPAATQLFTPNWIVQYLVQNSLGRQWVATYPDSLLKQQMEFYIEPAEQTPNVQQQLDEITPDSLDPEELTLLDPACGSGHILVEAYDLFKAIYTERGYRPRDIPKLILTKNLYGLEIDDRAAQLSAFALMMNARADDRGIFERDVQPNILSILGSTGLDAKEITDALNEPILVDVPPPSGELFEEIANDKSPLFSSKNLSVKGNLESNTISELISIFEVGKTVGALIRIPEEVVNALPEVRERIQAVLLHGGMFEKAAARTFLPIVTQAQILSAKFDSVVANPPYMGSGYFNAGLKTRLKPFHNVKRTDLYVIFVERWISQCDVLSMVTRQDWMFTKSYAAFRHDVISQRTICSLAQFGPDAFESLSGEVVQACAFNLLSKHVPNYVQTFFSLTDGKGVEKADPLRKKRSAFTLPADEFDLIPQSPIVYWISDNERHAYGGDQLDDKAALREGIHTGCNPDFVRSWWEVPSSSFSVNEDSYESIDENKKKWIPYNKGGSTRRWYGANEFVISFDSVSRASMAALSGHVRPSQSLYFLEGGTWSDVGTKGFGVRYFPSGFLFADAGPVVIGEEVEYLIALMNSKPFRHLAQIVMPNLHYKCGTVKLLPYVNCEGKEEVKDWARQAIQVAKQDWDSQEESWDFQTSPLTSDDRLPLIKKCFENLERQWECNRSNLRTLEEAINLRFIDAYKLAGDVSHEADEDELAIKCVDQIDTLCRLISFSVGCMMGRYSLDEPGLIYAHSRNEGFDASKYSTFPADEDGIVPMNETAWFSDDAANRFEQFLKTWSEEHLEENLTFVAESLGKKKNESSRECIRRYMATGFYKHHLSMYKKRPIYWLFSSGKQKAFQCLVYLHRYNAGTLSRMRTEYVVKLQGMINTRIDQLEDDIPSASSTSHRKKLEKERDKLIKQREELQTFDEKLRHYADQRIELDLDDGVKVNYGKFGDLLADVKAITGKNPQVEVLT